jgi:hypothetical protein
MLDALRSLGQQLRARAWAKPSHVSRLSAEADFRPTVASDAIASRATADPNGRRSGVEQVSLDLAGADGYEAVVAIELLGCL